MIARHNNGRRVWIEHNDNLDIYGTIICVDQSSGTKNTCLREIRLCAQDILFNTLDDLVNTTIFTLIKN